MRSLRWRYVCAALISVSWQGMAQELSHVPYVFDVGTASSRLDRFAQRLTAADTFSASTGLGWTAAPTSSFERRNLYRRTLRDDMTYDGVIGMEIGFKMRLPRGSWWFTFWMEEGVENIPTTRLEINGAECAVTWHHLKPDEEGALRNSRLYRVIHVQQEVGDKGFTFMLKGVKDSVRLLGFSLIPAERWSASKSDLWPLILQAGKYRSAISSSDLWKALASRVEEQPNDAFIRYWHQQIGFLAEAERWKATQGWEWSMEITGMSIFDRMHQALFLFDANIENFDWTDNPLLERVLWNRGFICHNLVLERGGDYQDAIGKADLKEMYSRYPHDADLAMLNGVQIDLPDASDHLPVKGAPPKWAVLEREVLSRMKQEISWWVNVKQGANGEIGGKIDDDVEILREWMPMLLFGDETTMRGWKALADAVWANPRVAFGYSKNVRDVEHSAEFISDSTPELLVADTDSTYMKRLMFTADHFEHLWSAVNSNGHRFFRSAWLGATAIDTVPPKNRDLEMNTRALKPLRYLVWATRDPRYIRLCDEWSRAWLSAALRTDKGKPKGIIPASVRAWDEAINGDEATWYDPNMMWDYYTWDRRGGGSMMDQMYFTSIYTKNDSLHLPITLGLELIRAQLGMHPDLATASYPPGGEEWTAQILLGREIFWSAVQKWRLGTGIKTYDDLITRYSTPYLRYRLTGDETQLEAGLTRILNTLRYNAPMRTNLVVHTDRVRMDGMDHLKAMISGDDTREGNSPYFVVSWLQTDEHFTPLVKNASPQSLSVEAYSFIDSTRTALLRPWQLEPGNYELAVKNKGVIKKKRIHISRPGESIPVTIMPQSLSLITFRKAS